ncbi:tubulin-tyrosine ligase family-domain-containing protein [Sporodiniella umbellata]|nr:tubulin-tyrosine ligase family-domain-containing protein [Sporodiniella umbellata]
MSLKAAIHLDESYTHEAVSKALKSSTLDIKVEEVEGVLDHPVDIQWLEYEWIDWDQVAQGKSLANAYCIRKGLIRKAQLAYNVTKYLSKHPSSLLKKAIPETWLFELDHVDYFEEAMNDVFEVERDLEADQGHSFIIKPSLANKAAGIKVFNSLEQLRSMFEESDDEDEEDLSQVREWVIQRYVDRPLLVNDRKFHVRAYVLAKSNIQVFLYRDMLALFALKKYNRDAMDDLLVHLTNTCIQTEETSYVESDSVKLFWDLPIENKEVMFDQMKLILADVFDACTSEMTTFQAIPNAFELFGVDFLIDENHNVYFLEANAFPDFKQTGHKLQHVVQELFHATTQVAIEPHFTQQENVTHDKLVKVFQKELLSL